MAVEITSDNFEQYFIQTQDKFTRSLEQAEGARGCTVVTDLESIRNVLSMPGVRYSLNPITEPNAIAQAYVQIPYSILADALENMEDATDEASSAAEQATEAAGNVQTAIDNANTAAGTANTAAQNADASRQQIEANESTRQSNETTRQQNETTRQGNETARGNAESGRASSEQGRVSAESSRVSAEQSRVSAEQSRVSQASSDHTRAENDHTAIEASITGAENVNAQLTGMTVTITNRQGQSSSVNIGFEIYRTYGSVAAMNADAANVPAGKFVMIATTDPTSVENARLYAKNSSGGFTFLSDLDQASSSAWADWMNNQKPLIEAATSSANTAASTATQQGNAAEAKGNTAQSQGNAAENKGNDAQTKGNFAKTQGDYAKAWNDHPPFIGDGTTGDLNYWYLYNVSTSQYVKGSYAKGDDLHWDDMSAAEKERLINEMLTYLETQGFDVVPTENSTKPVRSGGIYTALEEKEDKNNFASIQTCEDIIDELI